MSFAALTIDLSANTAKLQGDLDKAAALATAAAAKIQQSADGAGQALGNASATADFGELSKDASAAAASMDKIKTAAVGTGSAFDKAKEQLKGLLESIQAEASAQFDSLKEKGKVAGIAISIGIGALLAGTVAGAVYAAYKIIKETSGLIEGLFTGETYKSKYIDSLVEANNKVKDLQQSLSITGQSASALTLALNNINVPKDDFVSVYTATESAIRKVVQALDDAKKSGDADQIAKAQANAFARLGVVYKDASSKLLDYQTTVQNAAKVLDSYTAGYDRNAAAAELGIGSAEKVANAAKLNSQNFAEAAKRQQDYYLVIGPGAQAAVEEYQQAMRDFRTESDLTADGLKRAVADATIPTLTDLANLLKDGFPSAVEAVRGALLGVVVVFETFKIGALAVYEIGTGAFSGLEIGISASLEAINKALHFDFGGAKKEIADGTAAIEARFNLMLDNVSANLAKAQKNIDLIAGKDSTGAAPKLLEKQPGGKLYTPPPSDGLKPTASGQIVDLQKKILDQQLKVLDQFISQEKDQLSSRDEFLSLYYQRDEVSIADYFAYRATAQREYLDKTRTAYAEEIADVEKYIKTVDTSKNKQGQANDPRGESKVVEAQTKIIEIRDKLRKFEEEASAATLKDWFANQKAIEQYGDKLNSLAAQIKAFSGDISGAFEIDFEAQNRGLRKSLSATLNSVNTSDADRKRAAQGIVDLDQIHEQGLATAKLNDLTKQRSVVLGDLQNQQERINLAVSSGATTELQGLADLSAANKARLSSLQQIVDAYDKIAATSSDPQARVFADQLRVELEKLAAQTDLVADKFNEIGKSATENFIDKLASGTVKLKDAFRSLFSDLTSQINKIASRNIAESLFGKSGGLGDFGSTISKFIGGSTTGSTTTSASLGGGFADLIGKFFGSKSTGGAAGAGLRAGETGAFDQGGSAGTALAANDDAFKSLTGTVGAAQSALATFNTEGIGGSIKSFGDYIEKTLFGTVVEATATDATSSAALSLGFLSTSAESAATALLQVAATSGASGGGGDALGAFIGTLASANGNVFMAGNVVPFARGGIVSSPTLFPMANGGTGLMGEAGPEAVMPLKRGADGRLGVATDRSQPQRITNNYINVTASQGTSLRTASQQGAEIGRQLQIAQVRNG